MFMQHRDKKQHFIQQHMLNNSLIITKAAHIQDNSLVINTLDSTKTLLE